MFGITRTQWLVISLMSILGGFSSLLLPLGSRISLANFSPSKFVLFTSLFLLISIFVRRYNNRRIERNKEGLQKPSRLKTAMTIFIIIACTNSAYHNLKKMLARYEQTKVASFIQENPEALFTRANVHQCFPYASNLKPYSQSIYFNLWAKLMEMLADGVNDPQKMSVQLEPYIKQAEATMDAKDYALFTQLLSPSSMNEGKKCFLGQLKLDVAKKSNKSDDWSLRVSE